MELPEELSAEDQAKKSKAPKRDYQMRKEMMLSVKTMLEMSPEESGETWTRLVTSIMEFRFGDSVDLAPEDATILDVILKMLIFKVDKAVRIDVSKQLAEAPDAPEDLVVLLAGDESAVAEPILTKSTALSEESLLSIIQKQTEAHRRVICERPELSPRMIDALIEKGQEGVLLSLVEREGMNFSSENVRALVEKSKNLDTIRLPLLHHKDMCHVEAFRIFWWATMEERQYILDNYALDPDRLGQILTDVLDASGDEEGKDLALQSTISIVDKAQWMREVEFSLLYTDGMQQFLNALVSHLELAGDLVRRTLLDKGHEPMAILCRAMGISLESYMSLATHLNARLIGQVGSDGEPLALDAIYNKLSPDQAAIAIAIWQLNGVLEQQNSAEAPAIAA